MEPEKNTTPPAEGEQQETSQAPADALSRSPEDLAQEQVDQAAKTTSSAAPTEKKVSPIKRLFRKVNIYFLLFLLLVIIASVVTAVNYLNDQKVAPEPTIKSQPLTEDALKKLANNDATVGGASQTLTIQGNAIIEGQTLMRGNLNIAGNLQTGGGIKAPQLTISGTTNLGDTQIDGLQVAGNTAIQGNTTLRNLSVAGTSSFSGAMTASQITVTRLILSGNATLQVPNHIGFSGPSPSRSINSSALGGGGSASVNGSDTTGTVNINTGNSPAAGCMIRITFNKPFASRPHVIISPVGSAAGKTQYYVERDLNGFSICASSGAPANQAFAFDYFITS